MTQTDTDRYARPAPNPGSDTNVYIPGQPWRVHDSKRPLPPIVEPGTESGQDAPGTPPSDAVVLFDGKDLSGWVSYATGEPAAWKVEKGYAEVVPGAGDIMTRELLGDCQLHVEWTTPTEEEAGERTRGNSGVFMMARYELQVLDCYHWPAWADGTTASLYGQYPPLANACRRPGQWQSYDIAWIAPRFEGDTLVSPAMLTMFHNGVLVHLNRAAVGPTGHNASLPYEPHPPAAPLRLQDHGHPVRFRNIWYRALVNRS